MAYKKKLTDKEFAKMVIDKELEIAGADMRYDDIVKLTKEEQEKLRFWEKYTFKTVDQYIEWRNFFFEHVYDWLPKRTSKETIKKEFSWFNLSWGLACDFPYEEIKDFNKKHKI